MRWLVDPKGALSGFSVRFGRGYDSSVMWHVRNMFFHFLKLMLTLFWIGLQGCTPYSSHRWGGSKAFTVKCTHITPACSYSASSPLCVLWCEAVCWMINNNFFFTFYDITHTVNPPFPSFVRDEWHEIFCIILFDLPVFLNSDNTFLSQPFNLLSLPENVQLCSRRPDGSFCRTVPLVWPGWPWVGPEEV